jgi:16S rRNA (cytosine967-C5)-methyltransferase
MMRTSVVGAGSREFVWKSLVAMLEKTQAGKPADRVFSEFCAEKNLGSHQRRLMAEHFFGMLRRYREYEFLAKTSDAAEVVAAFLVVVGEVETKAEEAAPDAETNVAAASVDAMAPDADAVAAAQSDAKAMMAPDAETNVAAPCVDAVAAAQPCATSPHPTPMPAFVRANMSAKLWEEFFRSFPSEQAILQEVSGEQLHIDLRVNLYAGISRNHVTRSLCANEILVEELPFTAGLRVQQRTSGITRLPLYKSGAFELQDFGSQIVAKIAAIVALNRAAIVAPTQQNQPLDRSPNNNGIRILDYCAGAGGKSLALLNDIPMQRIKQLVCADVDVARLANAQRRFERIAKELLSQQQSRQRATPSKQIRGKTLRMHGGFHERPPTQQSLGNIVSFQTTDALHETQVFDLVVVDAPCSGTGTIKRNPWLTMHINGEQLEKYSQTQLEILQRAAGFVARGGMLAYITCSLLARENEDVVDAFMQQGGRRLGFDVIDLSRINCDAAWHMISKMVSGKCLRILPSTMNTSGFFLAMFARQA